MGQNRKAKLKLIISMVIFGTLGPFVRNISLPSGELALYRAILAVLMLTGYILLSGQKISFAAIKKEIPLLLLSGAAMSFNWIFLFQAYKHTTVSLATLSYYFAPVIVTLVCPLIFREKMGAKRWLCFAISTLGIILITLSGDAGEGGSLLGILFGLCAAFLYATVVLLNKFIKNVDGIYRTLIQMLSAVIVLIPYVLISGGTSLGALDGTGWASLLVVGFIHTGLAFCLYFSSLKDMTGQQAAVLSYVDPLVAVLISVVFLGEGMTLLQIIGGALILGFTLLNELGNEKSETT